MQPMAAGSRRKSASRGNHAEISGRPVKMKRVSDKENDPSEASRYVYQPERRTRTEGKRKHVLKLAIDAGTQNAGKW